MAYRRFDDAPASADGAVRKLYKVFPDDAIRRALQSISNRVLSGTGGTSGTGLESSPGTGGTCGVKLPFPLIMTINGRIGTAAAMDNIRLPNGTQGSGTWVKYLIATKFGANQGTCLAGNEGASSTAARLPSLPDGYCAVGYMEYNTTSGAFNRFGGGTAGAYNVVSGNAAATCGTVSAWVSLLNMPYDES
jgi:hypothetical protein